jgi:hypothetical protein
MLTDKERKTLRALAEADGASFTDLVKIAHLDPALAFRGANLRDVDFGRSDLSGYDFTEADLSGANLERALIERAIFSRCKTRGTRWPPPPIEVGPPTYVLNEVQQDAVKRMLHDLTSKRRALVLMPHGTGRGAVLEEVIAQILWNERYRPALLLVSTVAEREQFAERLRRRLGTNTVAVTRRINELPFSDDLVISNASFREISPLSIRNFSELFGGFASVFTTSLEKMTQLERVGLEVLDAKTLGVVDSMPINADRPDRRKFIMRMNKQFGDPSFVCEVEQAVELGLLEPARIVRSTNLILKDVEQLRRGRPAPDELHHALRPAAERIARLAHKEELSSLFVLASDEEQLAMLHDLLNKRGDLSPERLTRLGMRWDERRLQQPIARLPGIILSPVSRQAMEAARHHPHVVVLTPLSVMRAQDLAYRPPGLVKSGSATVYDFVDAFSGFPKLWQ